MHDIGDTEDCGNIKRDKFEAIYAQKNSQSV